MSEETEWEDAEEPIYYVGDGDRNADWILTPEERREEMEITEEALRRFQEQSP